MAAPVCIFKRSAPGHSGRALLREKVLSSSTAPPDAAYRLLLRELGCQPLYGELEHLRRMVDGLPAWFRHVFHSRAGQRKSTGQQRRQALPSSMKSNLMDVFSIYALICLGSNLST